MGRSVGRSKNWGRRSKNRNKGQKNLKKTQSDNWKMQATDGVVLNDDCLLKIFQYLNISDLVNVAVSSKHFKFLARDLFKRTFAKDVVTVTNESTAAGGQPSVLLLAHFGDLIPKLRIEYANRCKHLNYEDAISEYCRKSVIEVELKDCDHLVFNQIVRPFTAVSKVLFTRCPTGKLITKFNQLFPNARRLDIEDTPTVTDLVQLNFPQLEHFGFSHLHYIHIAETAARYRTIPIATIKLNPQLKSLTLKCDRMYITPDHLSVISENLPLLETLDIIVGGGTSAKQIHFPNLRNFTIDLLWWSFLSEFRVTTRLPVDFTLNGRWLCGQLCRFLSTNQNWTKISLHGDWSSYGHFERFKNEITKLKLLTSIEMRANGLNGNENVVLALLDQCKGLTKFKVNLTSRDYRDTFMESIRREFDLRFQGSAWLPKYEAKEEEGSYWWTAVFEKQDSNKQ